MRNWYLCLSVPGLPHPSEVVVAVGPVAEPGAHLGNQDVVEPVVAEHGAAVALGTLGRAEEGLGAQELGLRHRVGVPGQEAVPWRVRGGKHRCDPAPHRVAGMGEAHVVEALPGVRALEHRTVLGDPAQPPHQEPPNALMEAVRDRGQLVPGIGPHLGPREHREHWEGRYGAALEDRPLGGQDRLRAADDTGGGHEHTPVPREHVHRVEVEECRRTPVDEFALRVHPVETEAGRPLADGEAPPVHRGARGQVARHAGDVPVAAQDLVERERLTEQRQLRAHRRRTLQRRDPLAGRECPDLGGEGLDLGGRGRHLEPRWGLGSRSTVAAAGEPQRCA